MKRFIKKYKEFLIVLIILIIIIGVIIYKNKEFIIPEKTEDNVVENYEEENNNEDLDYSIINNCKYKSFLPTFESGYDYTQDMEYEDKIYHKAIYTYEEYQIYKDRWNDILDMTEKDFENSFMIITAVENTSMIGLTISNIYVENDILNIELDKYPDGVEYDEKNNCISIIIPNDMKKSIIKVTDARNKEKSNEQKYNWSNESIEGLTPISLENAIIIAKEYASTLPQINSYIGKEIDNLEKYTKVYDVQRTTVYPNNYWYITEGIIERELEVADYTRNVYEVTLVKEDDEMEIDRAVFYVDMYTGKVIGGRYMSD